MDVLKIAVALPKPISDMSLDERMNVLASIAVHHLRVPQTVRDGKIEMTIQKSEFTFCQARLDRKVQLLPMT